MLVANPVFPIQFQIDQVAASIDEILHKKNWKSFEKGEIKLVLKPLYLFYYDAVFPEKETGKTARGKLALNAETAELSKEIADSMPGEEKLLKELPDSYPLIARKALFSKKEAEKIALLKTSALLKADRNDIVLTGFKMLYYPTWIVFVTVAGQTSELEISAVTGQIFGKESVPEREKGFVEVTKQTLQELKKPGAWVQYSKEIAEISAKKLSREEKTQASPKEGHGRAWIWITIALIAALATLILFWP